MLVLARWSALARGLAAASPPVRSVACSSHWMSMAYGSAGIRRLFSAPATAPAAAAPAAAAASASASNGSNNNAPAPDQAFAVVLVGGKQYKVTPGDVIVTEKLEGAPVGQAITLDKVLLVGSRAFTAVGTPRLENARVLATVEEQTLSEKVIVFKKRKRKTYRRTNGHRQPITVLRIGAINLDHAASTASTTTARA